MYVCAFLIVLRLLTAVDILNMFESPNLLLKHYPKMFENNPGNDVVTKNISQRKNCLFQ